MAETLGSLCDKLATVKLKLWHTDDPDRLESVSEQERQLHQEIDEFIASAIAGEISIERLTFAANKVYKKDGNVVPDFNGTLGEMISQLAHTNCKLWHVQEKVDEFDAVPPEQKDAVIKELAIVNLERNQSIDQIDQELQRLVEKIRSKGAVG